MEYTINNAYGSGCIFRWSRRLILQYIVWFAPIIILMVYGQKFQSWMKLRDVSKCLAKLKAMKDTARREEGMTDWQASRIENIEAALTIIYKNMRQFYLTGKTGQVSLAAQNMRGQITEQSV